MSNTHFRGDGKIDFEKVYGELLDALDDDVIMPPTQFGQARNRLAQAAGEWQKEKSFHEKQYRKEYKELLRSTDDQTGKPMAQGKAEGIAKGSDSYAKYHEAKSNIMTIEGYQDSLTSFQFGLNSELKNSR